MFSPARPRNAVATDPGAHENGPNAVPPFPPTVPTVTGAVAASTDLHRENSDVLPSGSVAVAVTTDPFGTFDVAPNDAEKIKSPLPSVEMPLIEPNHTAPSPLPDAWHVGLWNSSITNGVFGVLLNVPWNTLVPSTSFSAKTTAGKFCRLFDPPSRSSRSFAVTPSPSRQIPKPVLPLIRFCEMRLLIAPTPKTRTPLPLNAMTFSDPVGGPSSAGARPTRVFGALSMLMPLPRLPSTASVPLSRMKLLLVPMKLPWTTLAAAVLGCSATSGPPPQKLRLPQIAMPANPSFPEIVLPSTALPGACRR